MTFVGAFRIIQSNYYQNKGFGKIRITPFNRG